MAHVRILESPKKNHRTQKKEITVHTTASRSKNSKRFRTPRTHALRGGDDEAALPGDLGLNDGQTCADLPIARGGDDEVAVPCDLGLNNGKTCGDAATTITRDHW
jgi:hypothetical protein